MKHIAANWSRVVALCAALFLGAGTTEAVELTDEQAALLGYLDEETTAEVMGLIAKVEEWQSRFEELRQQAEELRDLAGEVEDLAESEMDVESLENFLALVEEILTECEALPEEFVEFLAAIDKCRQVLAEAEAAWQEAPFDASVQVDIDEQAFREEIKAQVLSAATVEVQRIIEEELFLELRAFENPTQYVQQFVEGKFREWTAESLAVGDEDSLRFRIEPPSPLGAIFDPNVGLPIVIEYVPNDIEVRATGLYFRYREGSDIPEAVIDQLNIDTDASIQAGVSKQLLNLGNEALAELAAGSPFQVTIDELPDLSQAINDPTQGAIRFSVKFNWTQLGGDESASISAEATGLSLYPINRVELNDATIRLNYSSPTPIVVGPVGIWEFGGAFTPATRRIEADTSIATAVNPPEVVGLFVKVGTQPPYNVFDVEGSLAAAARSIEMCHMIGKLDFATGVIEGTYTQGQQSGFAGGLLYGEGSFSLRSERLEMDGSIDVLGVRCAQMQSFVSFEDGSAELVGQGGFTLFGSFEFSEYLTGVIHAGFERVEVTCGRSIGLEIDPWGSISCNVEVSVDTGRDVPVSALVGTPFGDVRIDVERLDELDYARLRDEVGALAGDAYHQVLEVLAQGESDVRDWGADFEQKSRRYVYERAVAAGLDRVDTGIPAIDGTLGELSEQLKIGGGGVADVFQQGGGALSDLREGIVSLGSGDSDSITIGGTTIVSW